MEAPFNTPPPSQWGDFLREFAHKKDSIIPYHAHLKLNDIQDHLPDIFQAVSLSPEAGQDLKEILKKFSKIDETSPICDKISKQFSALLNEPVQVPSVFKSDVSIKNLVQRWDRAVASTKQADVLFNDLLHVHQSNPEINLDPVFSKMLTYFMEHPDDLASSKSQLANQTLEFLGNFLAVRDSQSPILENLAHVLTLTYNYPGLNARPEVWKKISFDSVSLPLLEALNRDVTTVGILARNNLDFRNKLKTALEKFHSKGYETTTPQAIKSFANLCQSLNKLYPSSYFLTEDIKHFTMGKVSLALKKGTIETEPYKIFLLKKSSGNFDQLLKSEINPDLATKGLDFIYNYQTENISLQQSLPLNELIDLYVFADEIENEEMQRDVYARIDAQARSMDNLQLLTNFTTFENILTPYGGNYSLTENYPDFDLRKVYQYLDQKYIKLFNKLDPVDWGTDLKQLAVSLPDGPIFDSFALMVKEFGKSDSLAEQDIADLSSLVQSIEAQHIVSTRRNEPKNYHRVSNLILNALSLINTQESIKQLEYIKLSFPELFLKKNMPIAKEQISKDIMEEDFVLTPKEKKQEQGNNPTLALDLTKFMQIDPERFAVLTGMNITQLRFQFDTPSSRSVGMLFPHASVTYESAVSTSLTDSYHKVRTGIRSFYQVD